MAAAGHGQGGGHKGALASVGGERRPVGRENHAHPRQGGEEPGFIDLGGKFGPHQKRGAAERFSKHQMISRWSGMDRSRQVPSGWTWVR